MLIVENIGKTKKFHKKRDEMKKNVYCGNHRKNRKFPQKKVRQLKKSCLVENIGKSENFHTQSINFE
jgi:hypothetical protein